MNQENLGLGHKITTPQERDAIHIAVVPVTLTDEYSYPGAWVRFKLGSTEEVINCEDDNPTALGIVDPYLNRGSTLKRGDRVWVYLKPGSITSLRHDWTHPAFEAQQRFNMIADPKAKSIAWLSDFAGDFDTDYEGIIASADRFLQTGEYHTTGFDTPERAYTDIAEFWHHYNVVKGRASEDATAEAVAARLCEERGVGETFFSCAC